MGNTENRPTKDINEEEDVVSAEDRELLLQQQALQEKLTRAINDGDENRRRLIQSDLDDVIARLTSKP